MAVKVAAAGTIPSRPALRLRWSWLVLAALVLLITVTVASAFILVR